MAGTAYLGEFEEKLRTLRRLLGGGRRILWIIPDFQALAFAGVHRFDPTSALDHLLPWIESGERSISRFSRSSVSDSTK